MLGEVVRHAGGGGRGALARSVRSLVAQSLSEEQQEKEQKEGERERERETAEKGRKGRSSLPLPLSGSPTTDRPPFCFQVLFRGGKVK